MLTVETLVPSPADGAQHLKTGTVVPGAGALPVLGRQAAVQTPRLLFARLASMGIQPAAVQQQQLEIS
jgi:hypothetical protein